MGAFAAALTTELAKRFKVLHAALAPSELARLTAGILPDLSSPRLLLAICPVGMGLGSLGGWRAVAPGDLRPPLVARNG